MKSKNMLVASGIGLCLTLALLWLLSGSSAPVTAASALNRAERPAERPLADAAYIVRYVAITGTDSGNCSTPANACLTVQYAVDQAGDGDEIRVAAGTYTGVSARENVTQAVYISKTVTVRGGYTTTNGFSNPPDPEANPTTLDAQAQGRVFYITGDISPTLEGLRITGGDAGTGNGGGMFVITATATISNNQVFDNAAGLGGGVYLRYSEATLSGNTVISNTGTGLYLWHSAATLHGNTVILNTSAGLGGGLYLGYSDATLSGNTVVSNTADSGGGLFLEYSDATLSGNTVTSNTADWYGGGLYLYWSAATLSSNTVTANTAAQGGGGLFLDFLSNAILINNFVADNQADTTGSGLYINGSSPRLLHTTVAHNSGGDGSGIYVTSSGMFYSTVALTNTILVSHTVGVYVDNGNTTTLESTLWNGNTTNWGGAGTINRSHDHTGAPAFVDPDAGDYHIGLASAAIDKGVDAGVTVDIDGELRPVGDGYDIGADEFQAALTVVKQADPNPVQAGAQLTYTIQITNTGNVTLTATITDILPSHITPSEIHTWTPVTITPNNVWTQQVIVTVETGYAGPLTNVVQVTTDEGVTGVYTETSTAITTPLNQAPYMPSNPTPFDGATAVPITQTLHWQGGDPDGDWVTYTIAFGTSDPPPVVATITLTNYAPTLITDTTYYWAVTSSDGISMSIGPVWRFTTVGFKYVYLPLVLKNF